MTTGEALNGKPYAGNPYVRFDEGEVASGATPRRGSLLYIVTATSLLCAQALFAGISSPASGEEVAFVRSASLSIGIDKTNGRVIRIETANGTDLTPKAAADLFKMQLTRADDFSINERIYPGKAALNLSQMG